MVEYDAQSSPAKIWVNKVRLNALSIFELGYLIIAGLRSITNLHFTVFIHFKEILNLFLCEMSK